MIEFDFSELYLLNKLLNKIKYSELDIYELNLIASSPITNSIMAKIQTEFKPLAEKIPKIENTRVPKFEFKLENHIGKAISQRLQQMDMSIFQTVAKWEKSQTEKYAKDILGIIHYEESELNNLTEYIINLSKEKTSG